MLSKMPIIFEFFIVFNFQINRRQLVDKRSFFILVLFYLNFPIYRQIGSYESEADLSVVLSRAHCYSS